MLSPIDHAAPVVLGEKLHCRYSTRQETGEAHRTRLDRADQRVPLHGVNLRMSLLKDIHDHHFGVEIAAEVGGERRVLASGHDSALRVDEQGADSVVSAQRRYTRPRRVADPGWW